MIILFCFQKEKNWFSISILTQILEIKKSHLGFNPRWPIVIFDLIIEQQQYQVQQNQQ